MSSKKKLLEWTCLFIKRSVLFWKVRPETTLLTSSSSTDVARSRTSEEWLQREPAHFRYLFVFFISVWLSQISDLLCFPHQERRLCADRHKHGDRKGSKEGKITNPLNSGSHTDRERPEKVCLTRDRWREKLDYHTPPLNMLFCFFSKTFRLTYCAFID